MSGSHGARPSRLREFGWLAVGAMGLTAVLQLGLAAGIVPIEWAWGGRQDELSPAIRVASVASAGLLVLFAVVVWRRAGLGGRPPDGSRLVVVALWVITGLSMLSSIGNVASPSTGERLLRRSRLPWRLAVWVSH